VDLDAQFDILSNLVAIPRFSVLAVESDLLWIR
jgi:hypothetical protein